MIQPADLVYREGSMDDKEQLLQLAVLSYAVHFHLLTPENREKLNNVLHNEERLAELLKVAKVFVCCHLNEIVGMAYLVPHGNPNPIFKTEWCQLRMVGVNPAYTGLGIARNLTKKCIDHATKSGEKTMALHTSEFMDAARHIYESEGFTILKEIDPLYGKKYWLYTLDLSTG